jgi:hypothetical protein
MHTIRSRQGRFLYIGLLLVGLAAVSWGLFGTTAQLNNRINDAEILFRVEQRLVLHPWDCVTVYWQVSNIEKVFFDDQAAVGEQTVRYCPHNANFADPTLYIDFQNNFIQRYIIPVMLLTAQWWFWVVLAVMFVYGYLSFGPLPRPRQVAAEAETKAVTLRLSRRALLVGTGGTLLLALVGWDRWTAIQSMRAITLDDGWVLDEAEVKP